MSRGKHRRRPPLQHYAWLVLIVVLFLAVLGAFITASGRQAPTTTTNPTQPSAGARMGRP